jgi:hypothetical protein
MDLILRILTGGVRKAGRGRPQGREYFLLKRQTAWLPTRGHPFFSGQGLRGDFDKFWGGDF